ncbi:MAG: hypothetical protein ACKOTB_11735 [Planctomycetia bacterium]
MASTQPTPGAIRTIVEEVLRRIATESRPAAAVGPAPFQTAPTPTPLPTAGSKPESPTAITARVVTLDVIARLPAGVRQVTVPRGAVITPSARDRARELGLALVPAQVRATAAAARPFVIAHAETGGDAVRRCAAIARGVPGAQQVPASGLAQVVAEIAVHAARDGSRCVLLTGRPSVAAVLANRHPGVRAIAGHDAAALARAAGECAANLLVANPADFTGSLERTCIAFATHDHAAVPTELCGTVPPPATPCSCQSHPH